MAETVYVFTQQQLLDFIEGYFDVDFDASGRDAFFRLVDDLVKKGRLDRRQEQRGKREGPFCVPTE